MSFTTTLFKLIEKADSITMNMERADARPVGQPGRLNRYDISIDEGYESHYFEDQTVVVTNGCCTAKACNEDDDELEGEEHEIVFMMYRDITEGDLA